MFKYSAYVSKEIFCLWQFKKKNQTYYLDISDMYYFNN